MKELADFLEKMDAYFEGKSSTERLALILLPAILVGYLAWTVLNPPAEAAFNRSVADRKHVEKQLVEHKKYLQDITKNGDRDYYVKEYDSKIALSKKRAELYRKKIALLDENLFKLSDMLFNQKSWSLFLDSITQRAHENNVQIDSMSNTYVDNNGSFGHVLEVGIRCQGSYGGIMKFMNDLEQNTLVTDIYQSAIYTESNDTNVHADLNISVWGVNH
jgi:hypothetical protein